MLAKIDKYFEEVICTVCLSVVVFSALLQVVLRFFFSSAAVWAEETAVYGMIFSVYFGATMAVRDRSHIRITLLVNVLPRALQVVSIVIADILWAGFIVLMVFQSVYYSQLLFSVTYQTPGLGIEQAWVQVVIPFAFCLMIFRIGQVYWSWYLNNWKGLPI
jgi:C4-dicarboxylate transporter DctM subunit